MGWGDEIMVTGIARRMQERNPLAVRVVDKAGRARWSAIWDGNPRLARPGYTGRVQTLVNGPGRRPYIERQGDECWTWRDWICPVGEIHLDAGERAFGERHAGKVLLEPRLKPGASPNKDWGGARWADLARRLRRRGHALAQFTTAGIEPLPGVEAIACRSFREACAVLARARLAVLPEGGLHHAAAALRTPSIVIFGGFISPRQTGYPHQVSLFTGGAPCGRRRACHHCAAAMSRIAPADVAARAEALIDASAPVDD